MSEGWKRLLIVLYAVVAIVVSVKWIGDLFGSLLIFFIFPSIVWQIVVRVRGKASAQNNGDSGL
jgi:hypothetical protein